MPSQIKHDAPTAAPLSTSHHVGVPQKIRKICCIGAGYVGGPTSAVMATQNPDIEVSVVDYDAQRVAAWQTDDIPIHEPGLLSLVKTARDGVPGKRSPNLFFSTDVDRCITEAELILLSVNTPTKSVGRGAGHASELCYLEAAVRKIGAVAVSSKVVVEKSTVPCRAAETLRNILVATAKPGLHFEILSNPEFLAEGTAVKNLLEPDRILIGSLKTPSGQLAAKALADVYASWVPQDRIVTIDLYSSELAKLAANALLAQRISSINALSTICESVGADIDHVSYAIGLDKRIGPRMLKASVGFGGSCFRKDILSLAYIAESLHLFEVAEYFRAVNSINEYQKDRFTRRIVRCLYNSLSNKTLAVLGFAYKKDTGDTRETPAATIVNGLIAEGADVRVYDPQVREEMVWREVQSSAADKVQTEERLSVCRSAYEACQGADAVVILTEWDEFSNKVSGELGSKESPCDATGRMQKRINWAQISEAMRRPMFVFDGRNILDPKPLEVLGFHVESIGKSAEAVR
uniref:UDP-glucose 6-dehydrogenase n=1 Tax=Phoma herbarum TaxID=73001 RepID=B5L017_9PLEO|nr:UDP-glucose 6-dehydrogenase [Phoma herbarum]